MNRVSGIIIGAARSGTTTLASYLNAHPFVDFSKEKEVHSFAFDDLFRKGEKYLNSFFSNDGRCKITADTYLLIDEKAPARIKKYNPKMKFILILRNPVLRAFSGYHYSVRNGYLQNNISFIEACRQEKHFENTENIVLKNNRCNVLRSKYFSALKYWMLFFPKDRFLLLKTTDLKENPSLVIKQVSDFLGIPDAAISIKEEVNNSAFKVRSKAIQQFLVNRNNPVRLFLKKIIPSAFNRMLIKTGVIKKIAALNRQTGSYENIKPEEFSFAYNLLKDDILNLKKEFRIDFLKP